MEKYLNFRTIFILGCLLVSVKDAYKLGSLREGEVCYKDEITSTVHVCKPLEKCLTLKKHVMLRMSKPDQSFSCASIGHKPTVCCPLQKQPNNCTSSKKHMHHDRKEHGQIKTATPESYYSASEMCRRYSKLNYTKPNNFSVSYNHRVSKIFGGIKAEPMEFPHMVWLYYTIKNDKATQMPIWSCGGSLISDKWILSAAHCASMKKNAQFWAKLGLINISVQPAQLHAGYYKIAEVVIHPFYDHVSDDVALFRLKTAVEFSAFIRPICLNTDASMTFETATVTGWSLHEEEGKPASVQLLKGKANFVSYEECNRKYNDDVDEHSMVCAGSDLAGGNGAACQGNSGGPIQVRNADYPHMLTEIGLTSYEGSACDRKSPSVFMKVSHYVHWIAPIVWPKH